MCGVWRSRKRPVPRQSMGVLFVNDFSAHVNFFIFLFLILTSLICLFKFFSFINAMTAGTSQRKFPPLVPPPFFFF